MAKTIEQQIADLCTRAKRVSKVIWRYLRQAEGREAAWVQRRVIDVADGKSLTVHVSQGHAAPLHDKREYTPPNACRALEENNVSVFA